MTTQNDITALRARVEALGYKLVTYPGLREHGHGAEYTGLYVVDPKTYELVIVSAGSAKDDLTEVETWAWNEEGFQEQEAAKKERTPRVAAAIATATDDDKLALVCAVQRAQAVAGAFEEAIERECPGYGNAGGTAVSLFAVLVDELARADELAGRVCTR